MSEALFKYRLKVSPRGKSSVRVRVSVQHGLEISIPKGYDESKVPALLQRKQEWVRVALERAESQKKFFTPEPKWRLPIEIRLPAMGKVWHVTTRGTDVPWVAVRDLGLSRLLIFGATTDEFACRAALVRWLMRKTREHLIPRLQTISLKTGLKYQRAFVKRQRTRWAGCSRHKTISLNAKLLFLPHDLVDYVLIHELCHVEEMNHTKRFWGLVERHCHNFRKLDERLRDMWKHVPKWAWR